MFCTSSAYPETPLRDSTWRHPRSGLTSLRLSFSALVRLAGLNFLHIEGSYRHSFIFTGVIGLTTALKIQEQGDYKVTIVAETLPSDPKSVLYTSHWAVRLPLWLHLT
jgi:hypothetical protein